MQRNNIVLTGGHAATTALATIQALKNQKEVEWDIVWIGSKRAVEGKDTQTLEFKMFPKYGIACYEIITGRLQKRWTRYSVLSALKVPVGFVHACWLLYKLRPKVIISFGGFAAFPVVVAASVMRIPVVLHEQTIAIGLANKFSIPFVKRIAISREESRRFFPKEKTMLTGNPVRAEFYKISKIKKAPSVIYATGGSRGSQIFNNEFRRALPILLKNYKVIHQTGDLDFDLSVKLKENLPDNLQDKYEVHATIDPLLVPAIFEKADIVIGRAGANTVAEVIATMRPAIFIPIPWSRYNEQQKNAELAESIGLAEIINQESLTPEILQKTIEKLEKNWSKMTNLKETEIYELDKNASKNLADLALGLTS